MSGREENPSLPQDPHVQVHPSHTEIEAEVGPQTSEDTQTSPVPNAHTVGVSEGTVAQARERIQ